MLMHVANDADARRLIALQKPLQPQIKRGEVRIILTYLEGAEPGAKWLASQLQADAVMEPIALKSLLFKIERYAKALPKMSDPTAAPQSQSGDAAGAEPSAQQAAKSARGGVKEASSMRPRGSGTGVGQPQGNNAQLPVRMGKALTLESDIWATMKNGFKFQGGRWTVQLKGPPPLLGDWVRYTEGKVKLSSQKENKLWVWVPKAVPEDLKIDPLIKEEGQWIFLGSQPKFQGNYWYFISARPVLGFFYGGGSFGNKLELDDEGVLNVASDSQDALTTLTLLETVLAERKAVEAKAGKSQNRGAGLSDKSKADEVAEAARSTFVMVDPLKLASDCFILGKEKPRRVTRKWVVSLIGPPPDTGKWVAAEARKSETGRRSDDLYWRWEPVDPERDLFIKEEGSWVFRGIQPRFIGNQWIFTAVQPELAFHCDGESKGAKLVTRPDGSLAVAKDSDVAVAFLPVIEANLEKVVKAKNAGKKSEAGGPLENAKETRIPLSTFGDGGDWAYVTRESGRRLYVYLPQELIEGKVPDPKKLPCYWTQSGSEKPELLLGNEGEEYLFRGQEPKKHGRFADLPEAVRALLGEKLSSAEGVRKFLAESKEAEKKAAVAEAEAASVSEETLHKIPKSRISEKLGGWEVADTGSQGRRWFVFLPGDYNAEDSEAYKAFKSYWTYFGQKVPRSLTENGIEYWTFVGREPVEAPNFGDLPEPVQRFFRASSQLLAEAEQAEARRKEEDELLFGGGATDADLERAGRRKRKGESDEDSVADEDLFTIKGRKAKGKVLEIELDDEETSELKGRFEKDRERDLKDGRDGEPDQGEGEDGEERSLDFRKDGKKRGKDGRSVDGGEPTELSFRDRKKKSKDAQDRSFGDEAETEGLEGPEADEEVEEEGVDFDDLFEKESGQGVKKKPKKRDSKGAQGRASGDEQGEDSEADPDALEFSEDASKDAATKAEKGPRPDSRKAKSPSDRDDKKPNDDESGDEIGVDPDDGSATPQERAARKSAREKTAAGKARAGTDAETAGDSGDDTGDDSGDLQGQPDEGSEGEGSGGAKDPQKEETSEENPSEENRSEDALKEEPRNESEDDTESGAQGVAKDSGNGSSSADLRHGHPSKPSLSPLSIAFLMSELQAKRDPLEPTHGLSFEKIGHRFCNYVSKATGEIRVELWARGMDRWFCTGTFDSEAGILTPHFGSLPANPDLGPVPYGNQPMFLVPVTDKPGAPAGSPAVGALVFLGKGVDQIDVKWAFAVGNMARGLLITLSRRKDGDGDGDGDGDADADADAGTASDTDAVMDVDAA